MNKVTSKEYWNKYHKSGDGFSSLAEVEKASRIGGKCDVCDKPVWRLAQTGLCFTCTTGEADDSEDFELEEVTK